MHYQFATSKFKIGCARAIAYRKIDNFLPALMVKEAFTAKRAKGYIFTFDQPDHVDGFELIPVWKWQVT